jgi:hypothetical protein
MVCCRHLKNSRDVDVLYFYEDILAFFGLKTVLGTKFFFYTILSLISINSVDEPVHPVIAICGYRFICHSWHPNELKEAP